MSSAANDNVTNTKTHNQAQSDRHLLRECPSLPVTAVCSLPWRPIVCRCVRMLLFLLLTDRAAAAAVQRCAPVQSVSAVNYTAHSRLEHKFFLLWLPLMDGANITATNYSTLLYFTEAESVCTTLPSTITPTYSYRSLIYHTLPFLLSVITLLTNCGHYWLNGCGGLRFAYINLLFIKVIFCAFENTIVLIIFMIISLF